MLAVEVIINPPANGSGDDIVIALLTTLPLSLSRLSFLTLRDCPLSLPLFPTPDHPPPPLNQPPRLFLPFEWGGLPSSAVTPPGIITRMTF